MYQLKNSKGEIIAQLNSYVELFRMQKDGEKVYYTGWVRIQKEIRDGNLQDMGQRR